MRRRHLRHLEPVDDDGHDPPVVETIQTLGANDVRVTPSESDQIVEAMRQRGIPVTYIYYSDDGHEWSRVANRRSFTAVAELFLVIPGLP